MPDLLQRSTPFSYEEEEIAYQNFTENVGFNKTQNQVNTLITHLSKIYSHIRIIGFSVGATVAWLCSEHPSVHKVIGFYGSRIRQFTDVTPIADTILIFGEQETSFNPIELKTRLSMYPNVVVKIVEGEHRFADPYSSKYNEHTTNHLLAYLFN